jgi:hypothetical protein
MKIWTQSITMIEDLPWLKLSCDELTKTVVGDLCVALIRFYGTVQHMNMHIKIVHAGAHHKPQISASQRTGTIRAKPFVPSPFLLWIRLW